MSCFAPTPFIFFSLTPEQDNNDDSYPQSSQQDDSTTTTTTITTTWMNDSECQENLFNIVSLTPEETIIDQDNHCIYTYQFFFEELGYFTEEPEPIDPTRDYEQEFINKQNNDIKIRQKHIDLERIPSLDVSSSGLSSSSSSIHQHEMDVRSPHYMGGMTTTMDSSMYHYSHGNNKYHLSIQQYKPSRLHN